MDEATVVPAAPTRVEGNLLAQLQAAFWKQKAMEMRVALLQNDLNRAYQEAEAATLASQGLAKVVENTYGVEFGRTHSLDIETGQITAVRQ